MRWLFPYFVLAGLVLSGLPAAARQPNVILLMSDDQGWGDVGFNGNERLRTPHLDAMAANGVVLERFYAASPLCSPTRGSCLTGRHPFRFGVLAAHTAGMRVGEETIAERLQEEGYATGFFGKWHLGWVKLADAGSRGFFSPPSLHGFEETFATTSAVPTWDPTVTPQGWKSWGMKEGEPWKGGAPYVHNGVEVRENLSGDDSRIIMDRVIDFVRAKKEQPFLATVWFHAPHEPVVAGPEYKALYPKAGEARQNYYGCITAMDEQIGRLREELRALELAEDTVIFFCSDNGPAGFMAKKEIASTGGFRGHKHLMYEGGLLVPACVEWPGSLPAGKKLRTRTATVDLFPTVAAAVTGEATGKDGRPIDGIDLLPLLRGEREERGKDLFFGYRRLVRGVDGLALIRGDWKILHEAQPEGRWRLYNLAEDPFEKKDLAAEKPELLRELKAAVAEWDESCRLSRDGADYRY
ncbi:sulfatase [Roseibacillus ishigakijimensis]|uniref:Sulfatase-like hydrolase/transferase n=1 Tax=Roseibacillus ishigakijimensis TaxID=454146 RepID=A0A934RQ50_9BACT|nr:sulfatase-like hydrolase/transferase [Roseibacillus ishigakijimensis]MBK1833546.1 sulfatase-like hydrolase/transferase [Roseibacillus ishigakijimensis]